jgi:hypothetical protein
VSSDGTNDTIHVVYEKKDALTATHRVYYIQTTNQVNPSRIRSNNAPSWSSAEEVSDGDSRSAANPSVEFDGDCDSVFAAWRGPGTDPDVWRAGHELGYTVDEWSEPDNLSEESSYVSDFPTLSTRVAVSWHEETDDNYDIEDWLAGHVVTKHTGNDSTSMYPHIAYGPPDDDLPTHTLWTERCDTSGVNEYKAYYEKFRYLPSRRRGEANAGLVKLRASQAYLEALPNPCRGPVDVRFVVPHEGPAVLAVLDLTGRVVQTLVNSQMSAGQHTAVWDGCDRFGLRLPRGSYYMRLVTDSAVAGEVVTILR